jgi:hypothetical protein
VASLQERVARAARELRAVKGTTIIITMQIARLQAKAKAREKAKEKVPLNLWSTLE